MEPVHNRTPYWLPVLYVMNLSLRHMRAFAALASTQNFTRAAEQCNLTQSAFSALISNLEKGLGLRLFSRNTRNVQLTSEGEAFMAVVATLLPETERALAQMRDQANLRKGRVAIAALPTIYSSVLPSLIAGFVDQYPGVELVIEDVASATCVDLVRSRQVDFALCASSSGAQDLHVERLASDRFYFVCRADHPLAGRRQLKAEEVQARYPIIVYANASSIRQHLDAAIYPLQWRQSFQVNSLSTAAAFVAAGLGATIVPTLGLPQFQPDARFIPIQLALNRRDICVLSLKDRELSLAAQTFVALVRANIANEIERLTPS
jgi:LysR family carnitine catabolism transcriptional activator